MTSGDAPRRFESRSVTSSFFRVLGVNAFRGRLFDDADARPDASPTVVVSHAFWARELGQRREAIGQPISFSGKPVQVIGVLPPDFRFMRPADVYPLLEPQVAANYRGMQSRTTRTGFYVVGRVRSGISIAAAQLEMETIHAALAQGRPPRTGRSNSTLAESWGTWQRHRGARGRGDAAAVDHVCEPCRSAADSKCSAQMSSESARRSAAVAGS
jgi:hypothetical protein